MPKGILLLIIEYLLKEHLELRGNELETDTGAQNPGFQRLSEAGGGGVGGFQE